MRSREVFQGCLAFDFVCDFRHGLKIILVTVEKGVGQKGGELVLKVFLNVKIVFMALLEPENRLHAFLHLIFDLISVQFDNRFSSTQETSVILQFVNKQS